MRRREFITLIGGAAAAWPLAARAQQAAKPVIGFLSPGSPKKSDGVRLTGLRQGLKESGYIEGQNVAIEYCFAHGQNERLPALAADLVDRRVAGMVTVGTPATLAAKATTTTIPIVFYIAVDPVQIRPRGQPQPPRRQPHGPGGVVDRFSGKEARGSA